MNRRPGPFHSLLRPAPTLSGGRAAHCWRRDGLRQSEKLRAVVTSSDWVKQLVYVDLRLSDQPLLGYTLLVLMAQDGTRNISQEEASPSRPRFNHVVATGKQDLLKNEPGRGVYRASPLDQRPLARPVARKTKVLNATPPVLQAQRQVSASMLQRLAGQVTDSIRLNRSERQREPNQRFASSATEAGTRSLPAERADAVERADAEEPSAFVKRPARRAENAWRGQAKQFALQGAFSQSPEETQPCSPPGFVEHWSTPVTGSAAPRVLITRLANSNKLPAASVSSQAQRKLSHADVTGTQRPRSAFTETLPANNSSTARPPFISNWPTRPIAMAAAVNETTDPDDASNSTRAQVFSRSLPYEADPGLEAHHRSAHLAPPALAPSLPPLLPPRATGETPLPVAAANAQRDAKRDEAVARGEDLNVLATQIERILKEEARRHGIDV